MKAFDHQLTKVARKFYSSVGSPVALSCLKKLDEGDWLGLVSMTIDPRNYTNANTFRKDYQCVNLLRKAKIDIEGLDRRLIAVNGFYSSEAMCKLTNDSFNRYLNNGPYGSNEELSCVRILERARAWLKNALGPIPGELHGRFGPGSTFADRDPLVTVPDKLSSRLTTTQDARIFLDPYFTRSAWMRVLAESDRLLDPETIRGNRFTTAPKDALKDRGICVEPSFNVYLQLAVGRVLKKRIRRVAGYSLNRMPDVHRLMAKLASRQGCHATIDLSNASDTVARNLVRWLLPADWFQLLDMLRSRLTLVKRKWIHIEKFSSMGNGFTFELETLIFASLCFAAGCGEYGTDFHVFGDDMIVRTEKAADTLAILKFCGFTPNERKTFINGDFRESCGGDFFDGVPVSGHFVKDLPSDPAEWISLANGLRRMAHEDSERFFQYSHIRHAWFACLDNIPSEIRRLRGPAKLGDLVVHDCDYKVKYKGQKGYIRVYRPKALKLPWQHWKRSVKYGSVLYGVGDERGVIPRNPEISYKIGYVSFG